MLRVVQLLLIIEIITVTKFPSIHSYYFTNYELRHQFLNDFITKKFSTQNIII
jgi:hypothetical protein